MHAAVHYLLDYLLIIAYFNASYYICTFVGIKVLLHEIYR